MTLEAVSEAVRKIEEAARDVKSEGPLATYMAERGFDPKSGCILVLPETKEFRDLVGVFVPEYVRFSLLSTKPMMMNTGSTKEYKTANKSCFGVLIGPVWSSSWCWLLIFKSCKKGL